MAITATFILITILVLTPLSQTTAIITLLFHLTINIFPFSHVTQALLSEVSSLRSSRGDKHGARRAQLLADKLQLLTRRRFLQSVLSVAWASLRHCAKHRTFSYRNLMGLYESMTGWLTKLADLDDSEWEIYADKNYQDINRFFKTLYTRFLSVAITSEPLKKLLEEEMEKGDLLRDCLEVGGKELMDVFQVLNKFASQFNTTDDQDQEL